MSKVLFACKRLVGKVAVITASTDGIGYAIAERLGKEGAAVFISSRKEVNVNNAVEKLKLQGLQVYGMPCHVSSAEDRINLLNKVKEIYGGIDIVVSNAAVSTAFGSIFDTSEKSWDKIFDVNVKSSFMLCKEALPFLEERGSGSIVMVSSIAGYVPFQDLGTYSITKTAILGMVKSMVPECAKRNVRINAIAPGVIKTKFSSVFWENENVEKTYSEGIPMKRFGRPEECAGAVAFLVSDDASYITGETIVISGGCHSRL